MKELNHKCHTENYIVTGPGGGHEKTLCKFCGCTIASLVPTEQGQWSETKNGKVIVYQPMVMAPTNMYAVIEIEMDDGSKHQTPVCKHCADGAIPLDQLDAAHCVDCDRLKVVGMNVDKIKNRKPLGFRKIG